MPLNPYHNAVLDDDPESPAFTRREARRGQGFDLRLSEDDHLTICGRGNVPTSNSTYAREADTMRKIAAYDRDA